jgi:hypothetical protein
MANENGRIGEDAPASNSSDGPGGAARLLRRCRGVVLEEHVDAHASQ